MLSDSISWIFSAVVRSIGEARFAGNSESKWHLVGDNFGRACSVAVYSLIDYTK